MHPFKAKWRVAWLGTLTLVAGARLASPQTPAIRSSATRSGPLAITDVTVIDVANGASKRVAERCGYELEGVMRSTYLKQGRRTDAELWSRIRRTP